MPRLQNKNHEHKIDLLESHLWFHLLQLGFITSYSSNPQIVNIDTHIIQFVFIYNTQAYSGNATYQEINDFPIPRYTIQILSIDYPVQSVWDSTICDYVFIPSDTQSHNC